MAELTKREFIQQFALNFVRGARAVTVHQTYPSGNKSWEAHKELAYRTVQRCVELADIAWREIEETVQPTAAPSETGLRVMEAKEEG